MFCHQEFVINLDMWEIINIPEGNPYGWIIKSIYNRFACSSLTTEIEDEEPTEDYETFENVMNAIPPEARPKPAEKGKDNKGRKISDSTPNLTVPKGNNEKPYVGE